MIFVDYDGEVRAESADAVLFVSPGGEHLWIPKSQLHNITYTKTGDSCAVKIGHKVEAIEMWKWLAEREGLV